MKIHFPQLIYAAYNYLSEAYYYYDKKKGSIVLLIGKRDDENLIPVPRIDRFIFSLEFVEYIGIMPLKIKFYDIFCNNIAQKTANPLSMPKIFDQDFYYIFHNLVEDYNVDNLWGEYSGKKMNSLLKEWCIHNNLLPYYGRPFSEEDYEANRIAEQDNEEVKWLLAVDPDELEKNRSMLSPSCIRVLEAFIKGIKIEGDWGIQEKV